MAKTGRPPKGEMMDLDSMIAEQEKQGSRLYKSEKADNVSAVKNSISESIASALLEMRQTKNMPKVRLEETDVVKTQTENYLLACMKTGRLPSMLGLAQSLGHCRQSLYWYMSHKNDPTSEWLERFQDLCSDLLAQNALVGNTHPIVSIFLEKAMYGMKDTVTLETVPHDDSRYDDEPNIEQLRQKYRSMIVSERDTDTAFLEER